MRTMAGMTKSKPLKTGVLLTEQHRAIDAGIEPVLIGQGSREQLQNALELLRLHLFLEEEILFPLLEQHGITMPIFVMKREHGLMWPLLQELTHACQNGAELVTLAGPCEELFRLLQMHNHKEEQIVYTAADDIAARGAEESLWATLEATVHVPDDWVCAMAPPTAPS